MTREVPNFRQYETRNAHNQDSLEKDMAPPVAVRNNCSRGLQLKRETVHDRDTGRARVVAEPSVMDRKRICKEFNDVFSRLSNAEYAGKLKISERTARGLRNGDRAPRKKTAGDMIKLLKQETTRHPEEVRNANQQRQVQIDHVNVFKSNLNFNVPRWFDRSAKAFETKKYEVAAAILEDRLTSEDVSVVDPVLGLPSLLTDLDCHFITKDESVRGFMLSAML